MHMATRSIAYIPEHFLFIFPHVTSIVVRFDATVFLISALPTTTLISKHCSINQCTRVPVHQQLASSLVHVVHALETLQKAECRNNRDRKVKRTMNLDMRNLSPSPS